MSGQPWYISHAETIAQNVVGQIVAFIILHLHGMPVHQSLQLQAEFFVLAYGRGYLIRRIFDRLKLGEKK